MSGIFDENQVAFGLEAPDTLLHTNAIFASAVLKGTGEALPLNCQWFNLPQLGEGQSGPELQLIPNVTGACFQPSIEDVGTKICVHALPLAEENCAQRSYEGMPLFAEFGPLVLDPQLEEESQAVVNDIRGAFSGVGGDMSGKP